MNKVYAGIDVGNGYSKAMVKFNDSNPVEYSIPSAVALGKPTRIKGEPGNIADDFMNNLEMIMTSEAFEDTRYGSQTIYTGSRAAREFGTAVDAFDVSDSRSRKYNDPINVVMILNMLAGAVMENTWKQSKKKTLDAFPEEIDAECHLSLAMPIVDFQEHHEEFENRILGKHTVKVNNFDRPIQIHLNVKSVITTPEGEAAHIAIHKAGQKLLDQVIKAEKIKDYTSSMLLEEAEVEVGIDIGEGTVNFPVLEKQKDQMILSPSSSYTLTMGYGTVLEMSLMDDEQGEIDNRKALAELLISDPKLPKGKSRKARWESLVQGNIHTLVSKIVTRVKQINRSLGNTVDVLYVYGGGANDLKTELYDALKLAFPDTPIIYMDSKYSRRLNVMGLYSMLKPE